MRHVPVRDNSADAFQGHMALIRKVKKPCDGSALPVKETLSRKNVQMRLQ